MPDVKAIRVVLVDDHLQMHRIVQSILGATTDIQLVGQGANGEEGITLCEQYQPDITLMDLQLPGMSGVDAIRAIRAASPDAKVIVLTMYHGEEDVFRSMEAGASTYLLKDTLYDDLVHTIRSVHAGQSMLPGEAAARHHHD